MTTKLGGELEIGDTVRFDPESYTIKWRKERAESERAIELLLREAEPSRTP